MRAISLLGQTWVHPDDIRYIEADEETDASLNIALNNPNLQGEWDMAILETVIRDLKDKGADLTMTGFSEAELESLVDLDESFSFDGGGGSPPEDLDEEARGRRAEGESWIAEITFTNKERAEKFVSSIGFDKVEFTGKVKIIDGDSLKF